MTPLHTMRMLPLLALTLALAAPAAAQPVEDRYHAAARLFVDGDDRSAEAAAEEALRLEPGHRRLQALLERIRERTPDDAGGSGSEPEPDAQDQQPGDDPSRPDEQAGEGEAPDDQPGEEGEPSDEAAAPEQGEPQDGREGETGTDGDREDAATQPGGGHQRGAEGAMDPAEAERLLRAIEADEQDLIREVQRRRTPRRPVERDW